MLAALFHHQVSDEGALIGHAHHEGEVVPRSPDHQGGLGGDLALFQATGLGAGEEALAQKAGLVEEAVQIHAVPAHGAQGLVEEPQVLPLRLPLRHLLLEVVQAGTPDAQPVQGLVGDMDGIAQQGARPVPALGQVFQVAGDQVPPALDEIAQLVGIQGVRQAGVYLQLYHPGSGQDFGGPDRMLMGDIGLEPAGLSGAKGEHGCAPRHAVVKGSRPRQVGRTGGGREVMAVVGRRRGPRDDWLAANPAR